MNPDDVKCDGGADHDRNVREYPAHGRIKKLALLSGRRYCNVCYQARYGKRTGARGFATVIPPTESADVYPPSEESVSAQSLSRQVDVVVDLQDILLQLKLHGESSVQRGNIEERLQMLIDRFDGTTVLAAVADSATKCQQRVSDIRLETQLKIPRKKPDSGILSPMTAREEAIYKRMDELEKVSINEIMVLTGRLEILESMAKR